MANHKSAMKRNRQSEKARIRNIQTRSACRTTVKKTIAAIQSGDKEAAVTALKAAEKSLASSATKRIYKRNTAARKISRLAKQVAAL